MVEIGGDDDRRRLLMRRQRLAMLVLLGGLVWPSFSLSYAQPAAAPVLARANLQPAVAAAQAWKPDAVLIQVGARDVGEDGKQLFWDYGFYSATAKTCLMVNVAGADAHTEETGDQSCESGAIGEFMDSDRAIQIARSNGITKPKAAMVVNVAGGPRGDRTVWSVMDGSGMKSGDVILDLDAVTGAVVSKTEQQ